MNIKGSLGTPQIFFSKENFILEISGNSFSENVNEIYKELIQTISEEVPKMDKEFKCIFKLSVFNSVTYKNILQILTILQQINKKDGNEITILWYYAPDDEDTKSTGEDIHELFDLNIKLTEKKYK